MNEGINKHQNFINILNEKITNIKSSLKKRYLESKFQSFLSIAFYITFIFSAFAAIVFQAPTLLTLKVSSLVYVLWILCLVLLVLLDYKLFFRNFFVILLYFFPFLCYLLLSIFFHNGALQNGLTRLIIFSIVLLVIGKSLGDCFDKKIVLTGLSYSILIASIIVALNIFFLYFKTFSFSTIGYVYGSKNSAAPVLLVSSGLFVLSSKHNVTKIFSFIILAFYSYLICAMRCRSVIICLPLVYLLLIQFSIKQKPVRYTIFALIFLLFILVFSIPYTRDLVLNKILFGNNTSSSTLDNATSGRISQIVFALENSNILIGTKGTYVDCLPINFLCSYGILGMLAFLPFLYFSILSLKNNRFVPEKILLIVIFVINSFFEAYGIFGPGAKTFTFWLLTGFYSNAYIPLSNQYDNQTHYVRDLLNSISKKIPLTPIFLCISFAGVTFGFLVSFTGMRSLKESIYLKTPLSNGVIDKIEPTNVEILGPEGDYLHVGERFQFSTSVEPISSYDKTVVWTSFDKNLLEIDEYGFATAKRVGNVNVHCFCNSNTKIWAQKLIKIVNPEDKISSIDISFEKKEYYVGNYIHFECNLSPNYLTRNLSYEFSDETAFDYIDSLGHFKLVKKGNYTVQSYFTNPDGTIVKSNLLNLSVGSSFGNPIEKISLNCPNEVWSGSSLSIEPNFYPYTSQIDFELVVLKGDVNIDRNNIFFKTAGDVLLQIRSLNNPNIKSEKYEIHVKEDYPVSLTVYPQEKYLMLGKNNTFFADIKYVSGKTIEHYNGDLIKWEIATYGSYGKFLGETSDYFAFKTGRVTNVGKINVHGEIISATSTNLIIKDSIESYENSIHLITVLITILCSFISSLFLGLFIVFLCKKTKKTELLFLTILIPFIFPIARYFSLFPILMSFMLLILSGSTILVINFFSKKGVKYSTILDRDKEIIKFYSLNI